jgi:hypothetical protein
MAPDPEADAKLHDARRRLDRMLLARDHPPPPAAPEQPRPRTTIGAIVQQAMKICKPPRAPDEGATDYARRLVAADKRLADEEFKTIVRRLYD